ncbi:MAG: serine hydrolase [Ottowia sp.]|nr:serine hydrolase [Ottowia sp.]
MWRGGLGAVSLGVALIALPAVHATAAPKKPAKTAENRKAAPKTAAKPAANKSAAAKTTKATKTTSTQSAKASARKDAPRGNAKRALAERKADAKVAKSAKPARGERVKATVVANGKGKGRAQDRADRVASRTTRASLRQVAHTPREAPAPRLSMAQMAGLHHSGDPLDLKSSVALVLDQDTREVLFSKNDHAVLPIASLTKLMTGMLVSEARLPLDEMITITQEDVDYEKGSSSRLAVGTTLTRGELMHLALMSSENRAAHALGRTYPGGMQRFVGQMNSRAAALGMRDTRYVEPTGLSSSNRSSAIDLATLVATASQDPLLRQLTTSQGYEVAVGSRVLQYNNTNRLVHKPDWQIGLQKTGYISEAGQCLVMQARVAGRKVIMVFLDSTGRYSRLADAERVRRWVEIERPAATFAGNNGYSG